MISVIVPVYNSEKYLEKCVSSILAQQGVELEVILVNDGSKDASLEICRSLEQKDTRVRVLDCPNGGVGTARNRGLDVAQGEYVAFVDSDDTLHPDMYRRLFTALRENKADIAECGFVYVPETGGSSWELSLGSRTAENRDECIRQYAFFENMVTGPCNKLYRRSAIASVRFPVYAQAEDAVFNLQVLMNCSRKITIPDCLYYYLQRRESGGHMSRPGHERDVVLAWQEIRDSLMAMSPSLCPVVQKKIVDVILRQYRETLAFRPPEWRKICHELKRDYLQEYPKQFAAEKPMTMRQKLGFLSFHISPRFYFWYSYGRKEVT